MDHKNFLAVAMAASLALSSAAWAATTPCTGINRTLPTNQQTVARTIAHQMGVRKIQILESFRDGTWRILYVNNFVADEAFLFYSGDPTTQKKYVTLWAGAAIPTEDSSIEAWTTKNAPGIPQALAACFAWHVTQDRDQ
jgi:hypothetical protein